MLQNEYLVANFGFNTAKNEPRQVLQVLAETLEFNTVLQDNEHSAALSGRAGRNGAGRCTGRPPLPRGRRPRERRDCCARRGEQRRCPRERVEVAFRVFSLPRDLEIPHKHVEFLDLAKSFPMSL